MTTPNEIHVVRRAEAWELMPAWFGVWFYRQPNNHGVIRAFTSRQRAEAYREKLERHRRTKGLPRGCNPFVLCQQHTVDYTQLSRFPESVLFDWLRDKDITPPEVPCDASQWYSWWKEQSKALNDEQWAHLWAAFDRVQFYEIVTLPMEVAHEGKS